MNDLHIRSDSTLNGLYPAETFSTSVFRVWACDVLALYLGQEVLVKSVQIISIKRKSMPKKSTDSEK